jgi:predicted  nucleic acid-binding Zn-ribbon protein
VALGNVTAGVNEILADVARVEKDIAFYSFADSNPLRLDHNVLNGKVQKLKDQSVDSARSRIYGRDDDTVRTAIFDAERLAELKQRLSQAKKAKQALQDTLLEANIKNEIELTAEQEAVLLAADLL